MKKLRHIWKYLTSSEYRFFVDLMISQEVVDRQMEMMKENIELSKFPPLYQEKISEYSAGYGIGKLEAYELLKAKGVID